MSNVRRQGRFSTNTASESYQRQLAAPAYKWRKSWVAPAGLPAESSYRVCKWVRVTEQNGKESNAGSDTEGEGEDGTPAPADTEVKEEIGVETPMEMDGAEEPSAPVASGADTPQTAEQPTQAPPLDSQQTVEASIQELEDTMDIDEASVPQVTTTEPEATQIPIPESVTAEPDAEASAPVAELLQVQPTRDTRSRTRSKSPRSASPASLPPPINHLPSNAVEVSMPAPAGHGGITGPGGVSLLTPEVGEHAAIEHSAPNAENLAFESLPDGIEKVTGPDVANEGVSLAASEAPGSGEVTVPAEDEAEMMPERDEGVVMGVDDVPMLKGDDVAPEEVE